jgi:hypothetical protein
LGEKKGKSRASKTKHQTTGKQNLCLLFFLFLLSYGCYAKQVACSGFFFFFLKCFGHDKRTSPKQHVSEKKNRPKHQSATRKNNKPETQKGTG